MLIKAKPLKYWIDNFYGYGSWQAKCWFIPYEEDGGELAEDVSEKINYFFQYHTSSTSDSLCDIRQLSKQVCYRGEGPKADMFNTRYEYRFGENAKQNTIWKNLIAFLHGYRNIKVPDQLQYQKYTFASPVAQHEALIPLYPLPSPHSHAWYYSWLDLPELDFIRNRTKYERQVYPDRIQSILANINTYKPEVVLMYGMTNVNALKQSVQTLFPGATFQLFKSTKLLIPQHHHAQLNTTTLVITTQIPALRHNRIETGFDWEQFGRRVKAETMHQS